MRDVGKGAGAICGLIETRVVFELYDIVFLYST